MAVMDNNYYVDPQKGNDSNPGTIEQPFRTIQHAINQTAKNEQDNNNIYLRGGTYELSKPIWIEGEEFSGTADKPLKISSYRGERVIIDGRKLPQDTIAFNIIDAKHIEISDLELRKVPGHGIEAINVKQIQILNNTIHDTRGMGIRVRGYAPDIAGEGDTRQRSRDIRIIGNEVYHSNLKNSGSNKGNDNWGMAIQAWNAENVVISNNQVHDNYGEGIGLDVVTNAWVGNNILYDNFSVQLYLDNVSNSTVKSNFIYNTDNEKFFRDDGSGVSVAALGIGLANEIYDIADISRYNLNHNTIEHNIVVGGSVGLAYETHGGIHNGSGSINKRGLRNTLIANNTFYAPEFEVVKIEADSRTEDVTLANNIFYKESEWELNKIDSVTGLDFQRNLWYGGDPGEASSPDDLREDPLFVNPGGTKIADYRLQSNSSAVDAAKVINGINDDLDGGKPDIGALESDLSPFNS